MFIKEITVSGQLAGTDGSLALSASITAELDGAEDGPIATVVESLKREIARALGSGIAKDELIKQLDTVRGGIRVALEHLAGADIAREAPTLRDILLIAWRDLRTVLQYIEECAAGKAGPGQQEEKG